MLENNLRKSLILSQGDLMTFVERPISAVCLVLAVILLIGAAAAAVAAARSANWSRWTRGVNQRTRRDRHPRGTYSRLARHHCNFPHHCSERCSIQKLSGKNDLCGGTSPWSQTRLPQRPPVNRDFSCEILVVGAGITGLLAAEHLASLGHQVCTVDRQRGPVSAARPPARRCCYGRLIARCRI